MNIKQLFCSHNWLREKMHFTDIHIIYVGDEPTQELRIYTVKYMCPKCRKSQVKETYIEKGLTEAERNLLVEETQRYGKVMDL